MSKKYAQILRSPKKIEIRKTTKMLFIDGRNDGKHTLRQALQKTPSAKNLWLYMPGDTTVIGTLHTANGVPQFEVYEISGITSLATSQQRCDSWGLKFSPWVCIDEFVSLTVAVEKLVHQTDPTIHRIILKNGNGIDCEVYDEPYAR